MFRTISFSTGLLLCLSGLASVAGCQTTSSDAADDAGPGTGSPDGGASNNNGEGGTSDPDAGKQVVLPKPVLCPEKDFVSPKLPNTVVIGDVVLGADATWTPDKIYVVYQDFKVKNHKLTVQAGTTICLAQEGKIIVGEGIEPGEIHLDGTADKPIVITSLPSASDPTKPDNYNKGLKLDTYLSTTISHVNLWYGGPGGGRGSWAFEITGASRGTDPTKPLLVDHVTVGAVQTRGISIATERGVADGSAIQFTGFDQPFSTSPAPSHAFDLNIAAIKSFAKAITLTGAPIPDAAKHANVYTSSADGRLGAQPEEGRSFDIVDFGVPYEYTRLNVFQIQGPQNDLTGAIVTFHEGVTWTQKGAIRIGATSGTAQGNLVVAGTAAKPVVFTSPNPTPAKGDWEGLYFVSDQMDRAKTKLEHVQILYAGVNNDPATGGNPITNHHVGRCGRNYVGAVMITPLLGEYEGPSLKNVLISHSASHGIVSGAAANPPGPLSQLKTNYKDPSLNIKVEDTSKSGLDENGACVP